MRFLAAIDPVAFFFRDFDVHWHGIFIATAIAAAIVATMLVAVKRGLTRAEVYACALCALLFGFVLSRLVYAFFFMEAFRVNSGLFWRFWEGGYSLLGAIAGVVLAILLCARLLGFRVADMLDAAATGGSLAIGIGRLSGVFSHEDVGVTIQSERWQRFPFAIYIPQTDSWSLAIMVLESLCAFAIFSALLTIFVRSRKAGAARIRSGDVTLLFMLLFGVTQTQLESMRVDALYLNTLGFVKVMEVSAIIAAVVAIVIFSVRAVTASRGVRLWHIAAWLMIAQGLAVGMYTEFRISAETMATFYTIMAVSLLSVMFSGLMLYRGGLTRGGIARANHPGVRPRQPF